MSVCLFTGGSQAVGCSSTERISYITGILAIVAAQIYSRHLDHNKENCEALSMTPTQDSTQLGFCVYLAYTAGILGLAALFVSSLTLIMTRDNGYQRLKESPIGKF